MLSLEERARRFASKAHAGQDQRRKYTAQPYIVHPAAVAELVRSVMPDDEALLAAAWLHDTVEDTATTPGDIAARFGDDVAQLVVMLTNPTTPATLNRAQRKRLHFAHTAQACPRAQTVKLADIIDNTREILRYDPDFARIYLLEKQLQLEALTRGSGHLYQKAHGIITDGIATLMQPPYNVPADWFVKKAAGYLAESASHKM
ncbi:bifunctional (p)ppGpp synthetase/guanosine-3',5'-bis(diphosphate) 3'-pyrophosphohydrolase [Enterobacteriaceae bacterium 4M9]|nr:bifunctional (p)ppGpp synthetase/guanosine-3',5'-bis(diphosphate) 3'-pyrophosphohydrolase [Enterobacteriaceae bacterium 4M9]